jgi:hypothetical protein
LSAAAGNENDTIVVYGERYKKNYVIKSKIFKNRKYYHDLFVDLGYNSLDKRNMFTGAEHESAADFPRLRNSTSTSFSIYTMFGRKIVGPLSIMSGLGIDWVNYKFSKDVTIVEIDNVATQVPIADILNNFSFMKKSKLTGSYLNVPVMLKMKFRGFFVSAGVIGGLNIGSHTKIVFYDTWGHKEKYKNYDIHLAMFRYGYSVRVGFLNSSLYVNYYVSPLFAKNEGPQVYPFVIGLSVNIW